MRDDTMTRVEAVLDDRVRPLLTMHGGAVEVVGLDDEGVLKVTFHGDCAGCPAADISLHDLVRSELLDGVEDLSDVVLVGGVSDELLVLALQLLGQRRQCPLSARTA